MRFSSATCITQYKTYISRAISERCDARNPIAARGRYYMDAAGKGGCEGELDEDGLERACGKKTERKVNYIVTGSFFRTWGQMSRFAAVL